METVTSWQAQRLVMAERRQHAVLLQQHLQMSTGEALNYTTAGSTNSIKSAAESYLTKAYDRTPAEIYGLTDTAHAGRFYNNNRLILKIP